MLALFIDLSKAFDTIDHKILMHKLYNYGIRRLPYELILSYLSNRFQCTKFNGDTSDKEKVVYGVPQGSVLGPLLFLLYINDILFRYTRNILPYASINTHSSSGRVDGVFILAYGRIFLVYLNNNEILTPR